MQSASCPLLWCDIWPRYRVVCAKAFEVTTTVLLRSYDSSDALNNIPATICEAVRATSAATSCFEPVAIGPRGRKFVDSGLEAQHIWCHDEGVELSGLLKRFVSIGTGNPGRKPIAKGSLKFFSETLVGIATQTEDTAKVLITQWWMVAGASLALAFEERWRWKGRIIRLPDPGASRTLEWEAFLMRHNNAG
jgi:hypothetical protein